MVEELGLGWVYWLGWVCWLAGGYCDKYLHCHCHSLRYNNLLGLYTRDLDRGL